MSSNSSAPSPNSFLFAGIQMLVSGDKQKNIDAARQLIGEAASKGAKLISLPECFNCPYSNASFPVYAEPDANSSATPTVAMLSEEAKKHKITLIGGSIPERDGDKLYNTSYTFGSDGELLATHRKVHLFDIDVPGRIRFKESETLSPGNQITTFESKDLGCKIGIGICYDLRFPEYAQILSSRGCKLLVYPGAFNTTTGPAHWELLLRGRALDNQLWVAAVSPARSLSSEGYQAWGHSSVISPWGEVVSTTDHTAGIVYAEINLDRVDEVRSQIPVRSQKRHDLYSSPSQL